jgi:hypothetical protein
MISSEPAVNNGQGDKDKEKEHCRTEKMKHFDLITEWFFAGKKEKRNRALKPANYP